jgi:hypothetical protein
MNLTKWLLTACCAVALGVPHGWSQPPVPEKRVDPSKTKRVEPAVARLVAATAPVAPAPAPDKPAVADRSKEQVVERPTKAVVAGASNAEVNNPTVEPGRVKWHKTLADARAASEKSGRPVLLFHMMGQLDKQFC